METVQAPARPRFELARFAAIGYVVCSLVPIVWVGSQFDVYTASLDEVAAHFAEPGATNPSQLAAHLLVPLAALFLVWALARIRTCLDRTTGTVAVLGGGLMLVGMLAATLLDRWGSEIAAGAVGNYPPDPQTGLGLMLAAGGLFVVEGLGAAVLVWAVALGGRRTRQLPGWLAWTGFVLVPLLPYAWVLFFLPWLAFLVWLVAASLMLKTGSQQETPAETAG